MQKYAAPPITEAVIEIRFAPIERQEMEAFAKKVSDRYPSRADQVRKRIQVEIATETIETEADELIRLATEDETKVVLLGATSIGVSRLAPYAGWPELLERFEADWSDLKRVVGYRKIERVAVRYVNRIDLPTDDSGRVEHERFINLHINLPHDFPDLTNYLMAMDFDLADAECSCHVISGPVPSAVIGSASFLLDMDVWRTSSLPQKDAAILDLLRIMRDKKNYLFETFVTDMSRELFGC